MASPSKVVEYKVKIPKRNNKVSYHIMKFNASLKVDPSNWTQVRMVRENNKKEYRGNDEEVPKYGAGSEFGREQREEARRRKYGLAARKYNPDDQPWLMRIGSKKEGKQYRGTREGGVSENAAYYIFTQAPDGSFEAHPVKEWYNFTPRINYNTLNAEEAEEKFAERGKILNHWAVMINKKLKISQDQDVDEDDEGKGRKKGDRNSKSFKVSDMDDWVGSDDELDSDSDDEGEKKKNDSDDEKPKKGGRSKDSKKKNKKEDVDSEGFEDSDDGDGEGREVDYMSDESSDSEDEMLEQADEKGIDQDEALANMLNSDSEEDEDDKEDDEDDEEDEEGRKKRKRNSGSDGEDDETGKKKRKKNGDSDNEDSRKESKNAGKGSKNNSRSGTPTPDDKMNKAEKRKALVESVMDLNADSSTKRSRMDPFSSSSTPISANLPSGIEGSVEEDARRYLARKPMTTTEVLKKLMGKYKKDMNKDELTPILIRVLKKINPHKQKIKGTMYLSLKKK